MLEKEFWTELEDGPYHDMELSWAKTITQDWEVMDASRNEYYENYDWIDEVSSAILHIHGKKVIFYFNNFDNPDDFVTVEAGIRGF